MRTAEDARVNEALEEAGEDLYDAEALARRPGGSSMSLYHCAQAAEKYLGALAVAADRKVNPMWDLPRVYEAVKDLEGLEALEEPVLLLTEFATPAKRTTTSSPGAALRALPLVKSEGLVRLGVDVPPEPASATGAATAETPAAPPAAPAAAGEDPDPAAIGAMLPREDDEVDRLNDQAYHDLINRMIENPSVITRATYLIWAAHNIERIADRATNISESVVYLVTGTPGEMNVSRY